MIDLLVSDTSLKPKCLRAPFIIIEVASTHSSHGHVVDIDTLSAPFIRQLLCSAPLSFGDDASTSRLVAPSYLACVDVIGPMTGLGMAQLLLPNPSLPDLEPRVEIDASLRARGAAVSPFIPRFTGCKRSIRSPHHRSLDLCDAIICSDCPRHTQLIVLFAFISQSHITSERIA